MPKEDKSPDFVVTDRRKFTLDGDVRPDAPPDPEPAPPAPVEAAAPQPLVSQPEAPKAKAPEPAPEPKSPAQPAPELPETGYDADKLRSAFGGEKIEFIHLLDMLVQTAMMYAGAMDTGTERRVDIVGMRQMIDMIAMLAEKTKGNLTEQEQAMISNTLFQLRMTYMEIIAMIDKQATQGGPGGAPKGPGPRK